MMKVITRYSEPRMHTYIEDRTDSARAVTESHARDEVSYSPNIRYVGIKDRATILFPWTQGTNRTVRGLMTLGTEGK